MVPTLRFDRGTLRLDFLPTNHGLDHVIWDGRTDCWRAPALRYRALLEAFRNARLPLRDELRARLVDPVRPWQRPSLRTYQEEALRSWVANRRQGVVVLPTGAGKTRVALAAMAEVAKPCVVLCPTRALIAQWVEQIRAWYGGEVGVVGDGEHSVAPVTVMTFASAYTKMDSLGDRFCLVVADEAHHFGGSRPEALEMCTAPYRLGLTATAPRAGTPAAANLDALIGPVVCRVGLHELVGTHLAHLDVMQRSVRLDDDELEDYHTLEAPFAELCRTFFQINPRADFQSMVRALAQTPAGRRALSDHHKASAIASFPREKRVLVRSLLAQHRHAKTLVFTALADDAYTVATDNLIPVITAEIGRAERGEILRAFREGRVRAIVSARVLNEGLDVPDASVGIVVAGTQGMREHVQRVGRVLRPSPGKRALVYELVTIGTMDHARAESRRAHAA
jgi:superfamily II DNA or RNA helicase